MMFKSFFPTFMLVCLVGANSVQSANILFFFGFSGHSHRITVWPLVQALADRGHKVTFYSPFEPKKPTTHPNITEMVVQDIYDMAGFDFDPAEIRVKGGIQAIDAMWPGFIEMGVQLCEGLVNHKKTIEWAKTASFDLVFINALFNDCGYGLAHKFKAPTILYSTTSVFPWFGDVHVSRILQNSNLKILFKVSLAILSLNFSYERCVGDSRRKLSRISLSPTSTRKDDLF